MSHFTVMVIGDDAEDQLAPYDENINVARYKRDEVTEQEKQDFMQHYIKEQRLKDVSFSDLYKKYGKDWNGNTWVRHTDGTWHEYSTYNPNSKWDWYELGGRWSGAYIRLKNDVEAATEWDEVNNHLDSKGVSRQYISWEQLREQNKDDVDKARKIYHSQPIVEVFTKLNEANNHKYAGIFSDGVSPYLQPKEVFVKQAGDRAFSTFAVVKDGIWYERGKMGWWAVVHDEKSEDQWNEEIRKMIDELPDDTLISIYDCHI